MKISEVAKLSGVTVRTLHYYDQLGLLKPSQVTPAGYRLYSTGDLERLQQILFFRALDFSLKDIREIMENPAYDQKFALQKQRELLLQKRHRIDDLIALIEQTLEGECDMSFKQFDTTEFNQAKAEYADEAKRRWGSTDSYASYKKQTANYDDSQWKMLGFKGGEILKEFAQVRHLDPASEEVQTLVKKWQAHITANFYPCTNEILACLGQMYTGDERFTRNIDQYGEGTAAFLSRAIEIYCEA